MRQTRQNEIENNSISLGQGITQLETGFVRPNMAACYIMESEGAYALIETGVKETVDRILSWFDGQNISIDQIKYIIPTHVHLDHAGGVGRLMKLIPTATLVIHPQGARHMIDPKKLQAGATAVYGEVEFEKVYGDLIPVNENRVQTMDDGSSLLFGNRKLTFIDTPGHARHHFCIHDSRSNGIFTGDTFGLAYPELVNNSGVPFIVPTTTPVQFDPEALKASLQKLMAIEPKYLFLTHCGRIECTQGIYQSMLEQIDFYTETSIKNASEEHRVDKIREAMIAQWIRLRQQGDPDFDSEDIERYLGSDAKLNAQGLDVWLNQQM